MQLDLRKGSAEAQLLFCVLITHLQYSGTYQRPLAYRYWLPYSPDILMCSLLQLGRAKNYEEKRAQQEVQDMTAQFSRCRSGRRTRGKLTLQPGRSGLLGSMRHSALSRLMS